MNKEALGTGLALITAIISGFAIPVNKIFLVGIDPAVFTAVRALMIGVIFFVLASCQVRFDYTKFKKVPWKYLLAIGIIGGGMAFLLYFTGLKFTTGGRAAFLHKTLPVYITILAFVFLKEKVTKRQSLALLVMLIGTFMLLSSRIDPAAFWKDPSFGDLLVLGATILWGVENVIARYAMIKEESNFVVAFSRMFFGSVFLFIAVAVLGKTDVLFSLSLEQTTNLLISTGILFGYVFSYYWSIKLINVSKASSILLLSPVISLLIGVLVLGEPAPLLQLLGSLVILIGAYFMIKVKSEFVTGV
ncbi:MAG: hypothetical protein DRP16_01790 [Candidatus Aenigmatarchaeota archaeon]|nr:MAG: hypothetical protein DRP16_01790 [Candidatus Aenigmarchaeota archaeon]